MPSYLKFIASISFIRREIHEEAQKRPPLEMAGPQAYERVGTVSFVGIELPVGELVLALRALWPSWHTWNVITGSLQRCLSGSATRGQLVARFEEDGCTLKHLSYELPLNNEEALYQTIQELAYQVMWSTLEGIEANSVERFKSFIEGVELFHHYKDTKNLCYFKESEKYLLKSIDKYKIYGRAHLYLGNLYNWRAYHESTNCS